MDKYDPNQWTQSFVQENADFCFSILEDTNTRTVQFLKQANYSAAVAGIDRMLNGAITINNAGVSNMKPFLAAYSFCQGTIIACGLTGFEESKRKNTAMSAFADARDFAEDELKQISQQTISLLESGCSLTAFKQQVSPDFPADVIKIMSNPTGTPGHKGGISKTKLISTIVGAVVVISIIILLIHNMTRGRNINYYDDIPRSDPSESQSKIENADIESEPESQDDDIKGLIGETYRVVNQDGTVLYAEMSLSSEVLNRIPYNSNVEFFKAEGNWARIKFVGVAGYCISEDLITEEAAIEKEKEIQKRKEKNWKNAYLDYIANTDNSDPSRYNSYSLIYIDGDDIPELYLEGTCEAYGTTICTYSGGTVRDIKLLRLWGASYIPKTGLFKNSNGNMGSYEDVVYKLQNGSFELIYLGTRLDDPMNIGEEPRFIIDDEDLSETEYEARFSEKYNMDDAVALQQGNMTYDQLYSMLMK